MADPRRGLRADLSDLQEPSCAGTARAFSGTGRRGFAFHTAALARVDQALDGGDDPMRRKLAGNLLFRRAVVLSGFIILKEVSSGLAMQAAVSVAGIALLIAAATLLTWEAKLDRRGPKLF